MAFTDICNKYNTDFVGYKVPRGAVYGKTADRTLFVCESPRDIKTNIMHVHIMKRSWGNNASGAEKNIRWNYTIISSSHEIFHAVKSACYELGYIPKVTSYYEPEWRKREKRIAEWEKWREKNIREWEKEKAIKQEQQKYALSKQDESALGFKKAQNPMKKCWNQSLIDGNNYDISWEENVIISKEDAIFGYNGLPVEYSEMDYKSFCTDNDRNFNDDIVIDKKQKNHSPVRKIGQTDFVICSSIFSCVHKNHTIQDINAVIEIMDIRNNETRVLTLPAGYCKECNRFFIFENDFQRAKNIGVPLCRIIDEKEYRASSEMHSINRWSQESLLRQYGYSVSVEEGLSTSRRQKILAVMIDIGVITRSEIKNYLNFFIRLRENSSIFERAVSKWEEDLEFVSEYNKGHYITYKVSGLKCGW